MEPIWKTLGWSRPSNTSAPKPFPWYWSLLLTAQWTFWFHGVSRWKTTTILMKLWLLCASVVQEEIHFGRKTANVNTENLRSFITVWTVVQAVLTATFNSYGDRQISTPYKINTPEPIDKKFGTVDNVRESTLYTKFDTNPPTGGFWENGWNTTKIIFYLYLFFSGTRIGQTRGWIFTHDSSKDVKSRKDVPFGGLKMCP